MSSTTTREMRPGTGPVVGAAQAVIDELTAQSWRDAGVQPGMRVLTAGRGIGELSMLAAATVGPKGSVVGVDSSTAAIRSAALRTSMAGSSRLSYTRQELARLELGAPVDAVLVRSALLRLDDPWAALRGVVPSVKPGGLIVVQELDDESSAPIAETMFDRLRHGAARSPAELRIAIQLSRIFRACGLPPRLTLGGDVASRHLREAAAQRPVFVSAATCV